MARVVARPVLAALAGTLAFLGFVGFGLYPLVFVAWVPMLHAIQGLSPRRAFVLGLLFGTVMNAGGYYWIVHVLTQFGDLGRPAALVVLLLHCVYQGGLVALVVYLVRRAEVDRGLRPIWTLPVAYPAVEWIYPQLFPANLGAALYTVPVLTQIVEVTGVLGLTALVAVANGAAWELLEAGLSRRRPAPGRLVFAGSIVFGVVVYGLVRLPMVDAQIAGAPKLKVALVQTSIGAREKLERRDLSIARHRQMSWEALGRHPDLDLVVWPESAYDRGLSRRVQNVAGEVTGGLPVPVVFGAMTYERGPGRPALYNSALLASRTGDVVGRFDKVRLVAFSEAPPWIATAVGLEARIRAWVPRASFFTRGTTFEHLRAAGAALLPTICYEGILGGFVREFGRRAGPPDALLNLTNDSWFGDSHQPRIHLALASFRSIETRRALIRATNTGISALVDPAGRIYQRTPQWTPAVLVGEVPLVTTGATTPYQVAGDLLGWGGLGLLGLGWLASAWARRAGSRLTGAGPRPARRR